MIILPTQLRRGGATGRHLLLESEPTTQQPQSNDPGQGAAWKCRLQAWDPKEAISTHHVACKGTQHLENHPGHPWLTIVHRPLAAPTIMFWKWYREKPNPIPSNFTKGRTASSFCPPTGVRGRVGLVSAPQPNSHPNDGSKTALYQLTSFFSR